MVKPSQTFFTSDLHLGHKKIVDFRPGPWTTLEEHDEALITRWNETVRPGDKVIVLGDFALGLRDKTLKMARQLHGYKKLVPGNHDSCHSAYKGGKKTLEERLLMYAEYGLDPISEQFDCLFGRHLIRVSHFPYKGEGRDQKGDEHYISKHYDYMPEDEGGWLIHGHVHGAWKQKGRQINVSTDVWDFAPVSFDQIHSMMDAGIPEDT